MVVRHSRHHQVEDGLGQQPGPGGAFFWEFSGDTSNGELVSAISDNL
ncbi:hypothetical protein LT493_19935 [Streptomyces tricolor]|nr:hypothetical protein [Streptomyces tricolor]